MNEHLTRALSALQERFAAKNTEHRGQYTVWLSPENIVEAAKFLRNEFAFDFLSDLTASDYWPQEDPRFHIIYQLWSNTQQVRLTLRVPIPGNEPEIPTVEGVWIGANWHEREVFDLFGVRFTDHSDMRRILMPYDWVGHPLRKDYPLGYEEPQFTFNFDQIQVRKHRGKYEEA